MLLLQKGKTVYILPLSKMIAKKRQVTLKIPFFELSK